MSNLNEYLGQKREAVLRRNARDPQTVEPVKRAQVSAEPQRRAPHPHPRSSGGERQPADFAGYDLGPSSPELLLGRWQLPDAHLPDQGGRIAAAAGVAAGGDRGRPGSRGGKPGYENVPFFPHNIRYTAHIVSPADEAQVRAVHEAVEQWCPILNLLKRPQPLEGSVRHTRPATQ